MPSPTKRIHYDNFCFDVSDDVYEPAEDSFLFAENLNVPSGGSVLDLGTGSGLLAVLAAKKAGSVLAVDLNPHAVKYAKANAKLNGVLGIDFLQSDLFGALFGVKFDLVLFNAPYLPSNVDEGKSWIERAWAGGADGRMVVDKFISGVTSYLKPTGRVLLMQSTLTGVEATIEGFVQRGLKAVVIAEQKLPFFETLTLIEAKFG